MQKLSKFSLSIFTAACSLSLLATSATFNAQAAEQTPANPSYQVVTKDKTIEQGQELDLLSLIEANQLKNMPGILAPEKPSFPAVMTVYGTNIPALGDPSKVEKLPGNDWDNPPAGKWYELWENDFIRWTPDSGWFDANKHFRDTERPYGSGGRDNLACWKATSANQLMWWIEQNRPYIDKYFETYPEVSKELMPGHSLTDPYNEQDYQAILDYFSEHFIDKSGYPTGGNHWFITGKKNSELNAPFKDEAFGKSFQGFFSKVFNQEDLEKNGKLTNYKKFPVSNAKKQFSDYVVNALANHRAVGFELYYSGGYRHAVTLWGAEVNAQGLVDYIYYTDSDTSNKPYETLSLMQRLKVIEAEDANSIYISSNYKMERPRYYSPQIISVNSLDLGRKTWADWYEKLQPKVTFKVLDDDNFNKDIPGTYKVRFIDNFGQEVPSTATVTVLPKEKPAPPTVEATPEPTAEPTAEPTTE
ncbi:IdeS/Mac family cysteine endopeptidase, partial [Boudabousia liubingyangii]|uniref:IdeS/Mac family cysteine endopeptidase n=1 Tax=Boudabousia liubingyangii TaxID=1921764 RepID=UPI0018E93AAF